MTNYNKIEIVQGDAYNASVNIINSGTMTLGSLKFVVDGVENGEVEIVNNNGKYLITISGNQTLGWTPGFHTYSIVANTDTQELRKTVVYKNTINILPNSYTPSNEEV